MKTNTYLDHNTSSHNQTKEPIMTSPTSQNVATPQGKASRIISLAFVLLALLLLSACGPTSPDQPSELGSFGHHPGSATDPADPDGSLALLGDLPVELYSDSSTRAVVVAAGLDVFDSPDGAVFTTLEQTTSFGTTRVLLVEGEEPGWVKVRLPARPNHRTGWIPAGAVALETLDLEVIVDLEARTLSVRSGIDVIVQSEVAIGSAENPTPTGTFYITDKLQTPDPLGAYGPYAFGLSGYSETLTEFAGGNGQIGIHGTNDPDVIGEAISHGCIRVPNSVIEELATSLPLGTPVHII